MRVRTSVRGVLLWMAPSWAPATLILREGGVPSSEVGFILGFFLGVDGEDQCFDVGGGTFKVLVYGAVYQTALSDTMPHTISSTTHFSGLMDIGEYPD